MCLIGVLPTVLCLLTCFVWVWRTCRLGRSGAFRWWRGRCCRRRLLAARQRGASATPCARGGSRGLRCTLRWTWLVSWCYAQCQKCFADAPLGRLALLLDLCEDALCLVVLAVRARRHLAVTLDLLLPAHVAGLCGVSVMTPDSRWCAVLYPCNPPPLGVALVVDVVHVILDEHVLGQLRRVELAAAEDARRRRVHHGRRTGIIAVWRRVHGSGGTRMRLWVGSRRAGGLKPSGYGGRGVLWSSTTGSESKSGANFWAT